MLLALQLTDHLKALYVKTAQKLKGGDRRQFMAEVVKSLGLGGQTLVERELGWNRRTIRKGMTELLSGEAIQDGYSVIVPCQINPIGLSQNQAMGEERVDLGELQVVEVEELMKVILNPIDKPDKIPSKNLAANDPVISMKS